VSGVVVACAVRAPAGPERTDDVLGPKSGWLVAKAGACGVASSNRPTLARRLRYPHVRILSHSRWQLPTHPGCPPLTNPPVLTALILGSALNLPGCKRLHLSFSPSWAVQSSGRAKSRILATTLPVLTPLILGPAPHCPAASACIRIFRRLAPENCSTAISPHSVNLRDPRNLANVRPRPCSAWFRWR